MDWNKEADKIAREVARDYLSKLEAHRKDESAKVSTLLDLTYSATQEHLPSDNFKSMCEMLGQLYEGQGNHYDKYKNHWFYDIAWKVFRGIVNRKAKSIIAENTRKDRS